MGKTKEKYDFSNIFISRLVTSKLLHFKNIHLSGLAICTFLVDFLIIYFFYIKLDSLNFNLIYSLFFVIIWINLAPYMIYYYDSTLLPNFFEDVIDIFHDEKELSRLAQKYDNLFSKKYYLIVVPWTGLIIYICINAIKYYIDLKIIELFSFWYFFCLILVVWGAVLGGIIGHSVAITILAIKNLTKYEITINPYHSDFLGGLSSVGNFAIGTTLMLSSGSLFLPLAFQLTSSYANQIAIYLAILIFIIFIILSFIYPTYIINQKAKLTRNNKINEIITDYQYMYREIMNEKNDINKCNLLCLKLERLKELYLDYKKLSLYPFEIEVLLKLISSIILPVFFIYLETTFFK
jgi:hypothetical protein